MNNEAQKTTHSLPKYDSNPFTLSFKGFGLLLDYARGVFYATLIIGVIGLMANIIQTIVSAITDSGNNSSGRYSTDTNIVTDSGASDITAGSVIAIIVVVVIVVLIGIAISLTINAVYKGFVAAGAVAATQKRKISAGQAFSAMGERFGTLFYAQAIALARIIGGYFLFIIPGIRAQLRYEPLVYIIMSNKDMNARQAVGTTKLLYKKHLMEVFGISTVGTIIPIVGQSIAASGLAMSVQQVTAYNKAGQDTPRAHFLNYLGLMIFGIIAFFIMLVVILVAAVSAT